MKRVLVVCLLCSLLTVGNGCCLLTGLCGPCAPYGACGPVCDPCCDPCGPACGPVCDPCCDPCGPACGPACDPCCDPCGPACGPVGDPCCDPCGAPCGDPGCATCVGPGKPCGPLALLIGLFHCVKYGGGGCDYGCGEMYCGDWCSEPPDYCDPCDCHGNWVGGGCDTCSSCGPAPAGEWMAEGSSGAPRIIAQGNQVIRQSGAKPISAPRTARIRARTAQRRCSQNMCRTY
jgi:hypothetical protein